MHSLWIRVWKGIYTLNIGGEAIRLTGNGRKTPNMDNFGRLWPRLDVESISKNVCIDFSCVHRNIVSKVVTSQNDPTMCIGVTCLLSFQLRLCS